MKEKYGQQKYFLEQTAAILLCFSGLLLRYLTVATVNKFPKKKFKLTVLSAAKYRSGEESIFSVVAAGCSFFFLTEIC